MPHIGLRKPIALERQLTLTTEQRRAIAAVLGTPAKITLATMAALVPASLYLYFGSPDEIVLNALLCQAQGQTATQCATQDIPYHQLIVIAFFVLAELALIAFLGRLVHIWREAEAGKALSEVGQIRWIAERRKSRYAPIVPSKRLRDLYLPAGRFQLFKGGVDCPPGTYYLSYLPHTRVLVEAEWRGGQEAGTAALATTTVEAQTALARALGFTEADLAANRAGRLSPNQRRRLRRASRIVFIPPLAGVAVALGVGALFIAPNYPPESFMIPLYTCVIVPVCIMMAGIIALLCAQYLRTSLPENSRRRLRADLRGGAIAAIEGAGRRSFWEFNYKQNGMQQTDVYYEYTIGDRKFNVFSRTAYNACLTGMVCHAYYAPQSGRLLSFERVTFPALEDRIWRLGEGDTASKSVTAII